MKEKLNQKIIFLYWKVKKIINFILFKFLKQENRIDDAKKVISRINLLNEEIKELKEFYKKK